ncbi:MAG TPA: DUF2254 domain-containing protein [Methyloceanibacter sp.]
MTWNRWYAFRSYLRTSLWIVPFIALLLEQVTFRALYALDARIEWIPAWPFGLSGTQTALQTIITLILSFIVFTFASLLVAIQVASGQLTPRIIATTLLRNNVIRFTVGLFVFTLLFALGTVARIETTVPGLVMWAAAILGLISIMAFLFLIDYAARLLRPVSILWRVGERGLAVIDSVYPRPIGNADAAPAQRPQLSAPDRIVTHRGTSAIVLAVNLKTLVAEARRVDGVIEVVPRVGDFVAVGEPVFLLHGGSGTFDESNMRESVAFGPERTTEQDSTFAFRVIVDIAIKALSKAINDPTTAVLAIDQLHRLLRDVGRRHLHDEQIMDDVGRLRVIFPTPNWDDFVQLAFREIRLYGAGNFQIARRFRAMIDNLVATLPESRRPALRQELELLDRTIEKLYILPEDVALARISDTQGLGGSSGTSWRMI